MTNSVEAFAKLNLTLEVLGKRADGYHALRSLVVPVTLADTLEIEKDAALSSAFGYENDLCIKAARVLSCAAGRELGAKISGVKRIPSGGGLGGGSADAAAVLVALDEMYSLGFGAARLAGIAADVGSDVPSLVLAREAGGVVMEGRGEKVTPAPPLPPLHFVVASPGVFSSTAEVYAGCKFCVTNRADFLYNMLKALESGDPDRIAASFHNDLAEAAISLNPSISRAMRLLEKCGAKGASVTGSGSCVFGLVLNEAEGRKTVSLLESIGLKAWYVRNCPVV